MIVEYCGYLRIERPGPDLNERLAAWQTAEPHDGADDARERKK